MSTVRHNDICDDPHCPAQDRTGPEHVFRLTWEDGDDPTSDWPLAYVHELADDLAEDVRYAYRKTPGMFRVWRQRLIGSDGQTVTGLTWNVQVSLPTFEHVDVLNELGWQPYSPEPDPDDVLNNSTCWFTMDPEVAYNLVDEDEWLNHTDCYDSGPAELVPIEDSPFGGG